MSAEETLSGAAPAFRRTATWTVAVMRLRMWPMTRGLLVYDVGDGTPELRGTIDGEEWRMDYLRDLALTSDGTTLFSAADTPDHFTRYDTRTLAATGTYGDGWDGYPSAVALGSAGAYVAAGRQWGSTDLTLYDAATGAMMFAADQPDAELLLDGVAFSGPDVFVLLRSSANRLLLWRVTGVALPASNLTVTAPARAYVGSPVTVEGQSGVVGTAMELTGVLTAGGKPPSPAATLTVQRSVYVDNVSDGSVQLPPVSVNADGTYTFTDTPAIAGRYSYLALWPGEATAGPAKATHQIMVE
ncbi:hypothetical protein ACIBQ1_51455 [Nonomuraea sp. NPDC050153]|uniref:hypothetical protein n=1 Tax=Nonomuraea sp. NPDC050153 TaxID=3364359 RepID=UPI0037AB6A9C